MSIWQFLLLVVICNLPCHVEARQDGYLKSIDTRSPRDTLQSFREVVAQGWENEYTIIKAVHETARLLSKDDMVALAHAKAEILSAANAFDTDGLPDEIKRESERRSVAIMKDILDRISLVGPEKLTQDLSALQNPSLTPTGSHSIAL